MLSSKARRKNLGERANKAQDLITSISLCRITHYNTRLPDMNACPSVSLSPSQSLCQYWPSPSIPWSLMAYSLMMLGRLLDVEVVEHAIRFRSVCGSSTAVF